VSPPDLAACTELEPPSGTDVLDRAAIARVPLVEEGVLNSIHMNGAIVNGAVPNALIGNGSAQRRAQEIVAVDLGGHALEGTRIEGAPAEIAALLASGERVTLAIVGSTIESAGGGEIVYYDVAGSDGSRVCDGKGLFVPGVWDESGARHDELGGYRFTYACMTGVIAKCVAWGYAPARVGADVHQACTRMARADYCGDGQPHTKNGTLIDVFDEVGVHAPAAELGMIFEAAWGPDGAVCVNHARYVDRVLSMGVVRPWCWDVFSRCSSMQEAGPHGALLANASVQRERVFDCGL
jgi:hypothetical protein